VLIVILIVKAVLAFTVNRVLWEDELGRGYVSRAGDHAYRRWVARLGL